MRGLRELPLGKTCTHRNLAVGTLTRTESCQEIKPKKKRKNLAVRKATRSQRSRTRTARTMSKRPQMIKRALRATKAGVRTQTKARKILAMRVKKALSLRRAPRMKVLQKALTRQARRSRRRS
jgi:hypothetical protein